MIRHTLLFTCAYLAVFLTLIATWDGLTSAWYFYTGYAAGWVRFVPSVVLGAVTILPWPIFLYLASRTPGWHAVVLASGREAPATVRAVKRTGFSQNNVNYARLIVDVQPKGAPPFQAQFELPELRVFLLDPGDVIQVKYDPQHPKHILIVPNQTHPASHRAARAQAGERADLTSQLERLAQLHQAGQLTSAEFDAAKRKLLG